MVNELLLRRAYAAYFRTGAADARIGNLDQPNSSLSDVVKRKGLQYVVLKNVRGVLAVYRVKNDGTLRRMKRWPKEIEE